MESIVVAAFRDLRDARRGMSALRLLAEDGVLEVRGSAVITRHPDGRWDVDQEQEEKLQHDATVGGGAVGALVGLLGGPLGLLLGAAAGATLGAAADVGALQEGLELEGLFPYLVPTGTTAVVADVDERRAADFDKTMSALGGAVNRLSRDDLLARLEAEVKAAKG